MEAERGHCYSCGSGEKPVTKFIYALCKKGTYIRVEALENIDEIRKYPPNLNINISSEDINFTTGQFQGIWPVIKESFFKRMYMCDR